jgi:hypothetical protein
MKKILFISSVLLVSGISLISCKKDSASSSASSLVGTWEATTAHTVEVDSTISNTPNITDSTYTHGHAPTITFNSNGTYSISDPFDTPPSTEAGTWTVADGKLTTIATSGTGNGGLEVVDAAFSVSGNKLTVTDKESVTGFFSSNSTLVLTRQ